MISNTKETFEKIDYLKRELELTVIILRFWPEKSKGWLMNYLGIWRELWIIQTQ